MKEIKSFLDQSNYDVRISGNARWIDQKCTPDVLSFVADCIINFIDYYGDVEFSTRKIWDFEYASKTLKDLFRKPNSDNDLSQNEYDKFFSQPLELLAYSKILSKETINRRHTYKVSNLHLLKFIAIRERNALDFLDLYITKVLSDSGILRNFTTFFQRQTAIEYHILKTSFSEFTIANTKINTTTEANRIFTKIINPLAYKNHKKGTYRGSISKDVIALSDLMYNRANFRDVWSKKPKGLTRQEWILEVGINVNDSYLKYQSTKAKKFLKEYNQLSRSGKSELVDNYDQGEATQIHHIFPESSFPLLSSYYENLIAITPTQHLYKAHPNNNTNMIDPEYQRLLLVAKLHSIEKEITTEKSEYIYSLENFAIVLNTGFKLESFIEISSFDDALSVINNYYLK